MRQLFLVLILISELLVLPEIVNFQLPFGDKYSFILDYTRNFIVSILMLLLTLFFVQKIIDNQRIKDEKSEERKKILRLIKLLTPYIFDMQMEAGFMTKDPLDKDNDNILPKKGFDFCRLKSFYIPSLKINSGGERAYKIFFYKLGEVKSLIQDFLINVDLKYYTELEKLFLEYIEFISIRDLKDAFTYYENNPVFVKSSKEMIEKIPPGLIPKREDYPSNSMISFITLYEIIDNNISFFEQYGKIIQPIIDNK